MSKLSGSSLLEMFSYADMSDLSSFEDCAQINTDSTLLVTTDFGPLVGCDCEDAATIAVLNAISDVYAMGGIPLYASVIFLVGEDVNSREQKLIFSAIVDTCKKENVKIIGGHSIYAKQTVIGLSVIGKRGNRVFQKSAGNVGDILLISKPIGTGLVLRGYYDGLLDRADYENAMKILKTSNKQNAELLNSPFLHSMTDITGFGLVGHLTELLKEGQGAKIDIKQIPILPSIIKLAPLAYINEYAENNLSYARKRKRIEWHTDTIEKLSLCDPQTNGPIMISASPEILPLCQQYGFVYIGEIISGNEIILTK